MLKDYIFTLVLIIGITVNPYTDADESHKRKREMVDLLCASVLFVFVTLGLKLKPICQNLLRAMEFCVQTRGVVINRT